MHYKRPPIKEAIFDIRIEKLDISFLSKIEKIHKQLKNFPKKAKQFIYTGKLEFKNQEATSSQNKSDVNGYVFQQKDNNKQVQMRLDGLTYNVLNVYSSWDEHFDEFFSLWQLYKKIINPIKIIRIATRYINRITLPRPLDFDDYITNMPTIPKSLPDILSGFFSQVNIPLDQKANRNVILTETISSMTEKDVTLILDTDVFIQNDLKNDDRFLIDSFNGLRKIKNDIFEDCITDKTRELFK